MEALEAGAHALIALAVDVIEQKQLAARPPQSIGQQAANRRAYRGQQAIEPEVALVVPYIDGQKRIHRNGNRRRVQQSRRAHAPNAELGQKQGYKLPLSHQSSKKLLQKRVPFRLLNVLPLYGPGRWARVCAGLSAE